VEIFNYLCQSLYVRLVRKIGAVIEPFWVDFLKWSEFAAQDFRRPGDVPLKKRKESTNFIFVRVGIPYRRFQALKGSLAGLVKGWSRVEKLHDKSIVTSFFNCSAIKDDLEIESPMVCIFVAGIGFV
jgi:hypothetical protein